MSLWRHLVCWAMMVIFPFSLTAADSPSAILHSKGGVWVNGTEVPDSTAIFTGDVIETKAGSVANLDVQGSSVLIQSESVVKFEQNSLTLDHGTVSVGTSTEMTVKVNCLTVIPIANDWTQYEVTDVSGPVHVAANKRDVNIKQASGREKPESSSQSATVHEGEKASRDETEACAAAKPPGPAGGPSISPTQWAEIGTAGGVTILLCALLCHGKNQQSMSESNP